MSLHPQRSNNIPAYTLIPLIPTVNFSPKKRTGTARGRTVHTNHPVYKNPVVLHAVLAPLILTDRHPPAMTWYPYAHPALSRIDSCSSIASDATAPNLPGAGRLLGLFLDASGDRLEAFMNRRAARLRSRSKKAANGQTNDINDSPELLPRSDTHFSIASDATAPNLPGAGRTLGLLLYAIGARIEALMNRRAVQLQLGPKAVAQKIRSHRRHEELSIPERYTSSAGFASKRERRVLRKLCKKLVNYSRCASLRTSRLIVF